jgi:hypothetical protein
VVIDTVTGAWSSVSAAFGLLQGDRDGDRRVGAAGGDLADKDTIPGDPARGQGDHHLVPGLDLRLLRGVQGMVTTCRAEVAASTVPAAGAPRLAGTVVTAPSG